MKYLVILAALLFIGCPSSDNPTYQSVKVNKVVTPTESTQTHATPEPATLILLGSGLVGLAAWARRKK